jgi:hypothetical protein
VYLAFSASELAEKLPPVAGQAGQGTSSDAPETGGMPGANPLETALTGFVAISNSGPNGLAVGGYSRRSANRVREFSADGATVTNIRRARHIAREIHGWDVASEEALRRGAMRGE